MQCQQTTKHFWKTMGVSPMYIMSLCVGMSSVSPDVRCFFTAGSVKNNFNLSIQHLPWSFFSENDHRYFSNIFFSYAWITFIFQYCDVKAISQQKMHSFFYRTTVQNEFSLFCEVFWSMLTVLQNHLGEQVSIPGIASPSLWQ